MIDPGEAAPVLEALAAASLKLDAILVTHHHADHTGGVAELRQRTGAPVWGPAREVLPFDCTRVGEGDRLSLLGLEWQVLEVPGHTAHHVAYVCEAVTLAGQTAPVLFCGDTLFSAGCGRLFEGTPRQMQDSLDRLSALPGNTQVCCAHEYTLSNLRFAREVDPANAALAAHEQRCIAQRGQLLPTLPSTLEVERQINPFLRCDDAAVMRSVVAHSGCPPDRLSVFAALRSWKNSHR
ncbi:hydroxyacylglutathione hydrolase [Sphaerotilus hippei]|uniref:Hydroxyacylglutathione hydrolase n=1 Tax=Sphaerotilus hippei TaxID=744406 RepID=A0A318H341_9BURK|nr:hydroxyacylglutathione hydrolase [Sphaerotilus hippei]